MKHGLIILFGVFILSQACFAQSEGNTLTGRVLDKEKNPLTSANIVLLQDSGKLVKANFSDEEGGFKIEGIAKGDYELKVVLAGFETYSGKFTVTGSAVVPDIILYEKSTQLNEVAIRAQKPFIEVRADKLVVNVENSIVSAGSSVMEVLQRSPGVSVDNNENISLKGKQGVMIWINGKQTPMAGADLANLLKSMPANSVDRIEIISNPGARYDAAGAAGIINIVLKKDQRIGANGSANISYGQGVYSKYGVGANLNFRSKRFNVYASYNYGYRLWFNHLMLNRRFLDTTKGDLQLFRYDQDNNAVFDFKNHIANIGVDYTLTARTTIGISVNAITNSFNPKADNFSKAFGQNDELLYRFNTTGRHDNFYYNYSANTYLKHTFDSTGKELSLDLDYARFGNQSNQHFVTAYQYVDASQTQPDYYLKSDLTGITQIRSVKADFTNPMKNNLRLEAGIKSSFVTADNEPIFHVKTTGDYMLDSSRTNHFIYNENINAAYVNANKDWEKFSGQLGLRLENTNIHFEQKALTQTFDTSYSYTQLFPSFAFQYHLNKINDLGITLSRRIERPNYQQLNPFKYFIDKTTYREGYARLQPASFYSIELQHTYKQRFITTFTYGINKGIITEVIQPSDVEDSVTVQTNKNLARMLFAGLSGSYSFSITKWWNNVINFNAYYARYEGKIANTPLNSGRPTFSVNSTNTFILPADFSAELGGWYQAKELYGYMTVQPLWMINAGIQKNLFDKRATLRFNIQDIFWKGYPSATSVYTGYKEDFTAERETRVANISFTYRFGKRTVPQTRRHNSGAEDEKRRANAGGA
ncbi:MAG TPA: outer membrane beta-barrel protein [Flavipsychrobacter sp.]|nr:outer membrane beta-barrel protein [Flavipsychrobacter sp.]